MQLIRKAETRSKVIALIKSEHMILRPLEMVCRKKMDKFEGMC